MLFSCLHLRLVLEHQFGQCRYGTLLFSRCFRKAHGANSHFKRPGLS